jgi:hypothetical protein
MRPEADSVRNYYFNPLFRAPDTDAEDHPRIEELSDPSRYDQALFVRQMHAANLLDCRSAREEFFNAEILAQEILDKGEQREIQALRLWAMALESV